MRAPARDLVTWLLHSFAPTGLFLIFSLKFAKQILLLSYSFNFSIEIIAGQGFAFAVLRDRRSRTYRARRAPRPPMKRVAGTPPEVPGRRKCQALLAALGP